MEREFLQSFVGWFREKTTSNHEVSLHLHFPERKWIGECFGDIMYRDFWVISVITSSSDELCEVLLGRGSVQRDLLYCRVLLNLMG